MPGEEIAAPSNLARQLFHQLVLCVPLEIDHHVPAKDHFELTDVFKSMEEIDRLKANGAPDLI